jgi:hypothetical protein
MNTSPLSPPSLPWRRGELLSAYGLVVGGAVLVLAAWWAASGTVRVSTQIAWLNVGAVGVVMAGCGVAIDLLTGRCAVGERRRRLLPDLRATEPTVSLELIDQDVLVTAARMTRYHRTSCPAVAGKPVRQAGEAVHQAAGLSPCGLCRPGQSGAGNRS